VHVGAEIGRGLCTRPDPGSRPTKPPRQRPREDSYQPRDVTGGELTGRGYMYRCLPGCEAHDDHSNHHCNITSADLDIMTFVDAMRKIYQPLGFSKGYNFPLCECRELDDMTQHTL
jgi:hypothetical protein